MKITTKVVGHVAKLANLSLEIDEEEKYAQQLSKILDYIDKLNEVDTSQVEPTYNTSLNTNFTQEDKVSTGITQDEALMNASMKKNASPAGRQGFFVTKGIFKK